MEPGSSAKPLPDKKRKDRDQDINHNGDVSKKKHAFTCSTDGCKNKAYIKGGNCRKHGGKQLLAKCSADGCNNFIHKGGVCKRHVALCVKKEHALTCATDGCKNKAYIERGHCIKHGGRQLCSTDGCNNIVVQGGVCVKHGAKVKSWSKRDKPKCSADGCTNIARKGGVCRKHDESVKKKNKHALTCSTDGCNNKAYVERGHCIKHGGRQLYAKCSVDGCTSIAKKGGVCTKHGAKVKTCGHEGCKSFAQKGGLCMKHGGKKKKYTCKHEGCTNLVHKGGVCKRHGPKLMGNPCTHTGCKYRAKEGTDRCGRHTRGKQLSADAPKRKYIRIRPKCMADGCTNQVQKRGLCKRHGAYKTPDTEVVEEVAAPTSDSAPNPVPSSCTSSNVKVEHKYDEDTDNEAENETSDQPIKIKMENVKEEDNAYNQDTDDEESVEKFPV